MSKQGVNYYFNVPSLQFGFIPSISKPMLDLMVDSKWRLFITNGNWKKDFELRCITFHALLEPSVTEPIKIEIPCLSSVAMKGKSFSCFVLFFSISIPFNTCERRILIFMPLYSTWNKVEDYNILFKRHILGFKKSIVFLGGKSVVWISRTYLSFTMVDSKF